MEAERGIRRWLDLQGLTVLGDIFVQNDVGVDVLALLTDSDLASMGISLGMRLRVRQAITAETRSRADTSNTTALSAVALDNPPSATMDLNRPACAERRLISVLFCDIVDSSRLASRLGAEHMCKVLNTYRSLVNDVSARHQAHVAEFLGDGALIYFGFPKAGEDDAERAVRAGLMLLERSRQAREINAGAVELRIGIASGRVVVDELVGDHDTHKMSAVGQIPHLAARLQQLASPGCLLIDRKTRRLSGNLFSLNFLGERFVKGFEGEIGVFEVTGSRLIHSRFEARHQASLTKMIGRDNELASVMDRWKRALAGQTQMVLLSGEAGIGKSRVAWEATEVIRGQGFSVDLYQCSPFHVHTAFFPFIDRLRRELLVRLAQGGEDPRACLADVLCLAGNEVELDLDVLAPLFDFASVTPVEGAYTELPEQQRARVIDVLHRYFAVRSRAAPIAILLEDLHWCDPTTLETVDALLTTFSNLPLFIIATARPELRYPFSGDVGVTQLSLNRLSRFSMDSILGHLLNEHDIPEALYEVVAARTDGVPLFIEELTRSLVESGHLEQRDDGLHFNARHGTEGIPDTLQASLMSRLDRLGELKQIAQMAACIGREFSLDMLLLVSGWTREFLVAALDRLAAADIIYGVGRTAVSSYSFKHALVRDVAYDGLLSDERRDIHARVAAALGSGAPGCGARTDTVVPPELLAYHLQGAGEVSAAIEAFKRAAIIAKQCSANPEAVSHLNEALKLVPRLPASEDHAGCELELLLELVAPMRSVTGFASRDVTRTTARAIELADRMQDSSGILPLLYNQWVHHFVTGDRAHCERLGLGILERGTRDDDELLCMTAQRALGATWFTSGDFDRAVAAFDISISLYSRCPQAHTTQLVGLDSRVVALGYRSLALWCLGRVSEARLSIESACDYAATTSHAGTEAFAAYHFTLLHGVLERDPEQLIAGGERVLGIGKHHRFEMWQACGRLLSYLGQALSDKSDTSLQRAEEALIDFEDMGVVYRPAYSTFLAQLCLDTGQFERGLAHCVTATELMERSGERWFESVTWCVHECLTRANATAHGQPVEALLHNRCAAGRAREQSARELERVIQDIVADVPTTVSRAATW